MINLNKGSRINLTKEDLKVEKVSNNLVIGLGWKEATSGRDIDCDASAIMVLDNNQIYRDECVVYYGHLGTDSKCIMHCGDNLVGGAKFGNNDSEQIKIYLGLIPDSVKAIDFIVNIYGCSERHQDFGMIKDAYIRVFDQSTGKDLIRYNLSENYKGYTGIEVARLERQGNNWVFEAVGKAGNQECITDFLRKYKPIYSDDVPADLFEVRRDAPKDVLVTEKKGRFGAAVKSIVKGLFELLELFV